MVAKSTKLLFIQVSERKVRHPIVLSPFKFYLIDIDNAYFLTQFANENDGYKYIAVFIDILSHYLYTFPMKTLTSAEMKTTIAKLLDKVKPYILHSDHGVEYQGQVNSFLKQQKIKHLRTSEFSKANYAEREIKR